MDGLLKVDTPSSLAEDPDFDWSRLLDKPKLNIERQRSFDERSMSGMSLSSFRVQDAHDSIYSPGPALRSGFHSPASSIRGSFETHPMVADAWDALRRSVVDFRGLPVGTIAAYDHAAEEVLNYDQVSANL